MKQIRVYLDDKSYNELKEQAKEFRLTLCQLAGLKLNGIKLVRQEE